MATSKKRSRQHIIDQNAQELLRKQLPKHWVLRSYHPDYGIDYALEVFKDDGSDVFQTLGEHVFVQLKGIGQATISKKVLKERGNVEKGALQEGAETVAEMEVISFSLETSELVTVQRMGAAVPVLLVIADLSRSRCHFVCLNDYIDKLLIPMHRDDYAATKSRTIHVPVRNQVADEAVGLTALRWYAKRAKLYAAFQKFVFQQAELEYAFSLDLAKHFAETIARYDFWEDTEMWGLISYYGDAIRRFINTGFPGLLKINSDAVGQIAQNTGESEAAIIAGLRIQQVKKLWRCLTVLPRNYEDVCREWFLPTSLGAMTSY